jgi:O-antigen/teichoic acid export membrane protein
LNPIPEPAAPAVGRHVAVASIFMVALRLAFRLIGLVSTFILVRLLAPSDFGLVALATAIYAILDLLTDMSFQMALIRLPTMERKHLDTAWTLGILRGFLIGGGLVLSSGIVADWMGEPRVQPVLWVLAGTAVLQGFENIGMVEFRRNLQFNKVFEYQIYSKVVAFCVGIPLAYLFQTHWALIAGIVSTRVFLIPYSYVIHSYRPRLSLAAFGELFHFSKWFLLSNALWVVDNYTSTILFSRIGGSAALGLFQVSWQVASLPASEIAAPIRQPIYAGYAKLLGDIPALRRHFVEGLGLLLLVIGPMSVGLCLTADLASALFLGPKWAGATVLIQLCAFYALFDAVGHFTHNVFTVLNRQRDFVVMFALILAIRFPLVVWTGQAWGVTAAVEALTITAALNAVLWMWRVFPLLDLSLASLLRPIWRTVLASAVMAAALLAGFNLTAGDDPFAAVLLRAAVAAAGGAVVYVAAQWLLWMLSGAPADGPEAKLFGFVRSLAGKAFGGMLAGRRAELG